MRLVLNLLALTAAALPRMAAAQSYYQATLATPATRPHLVTRGTLWQCEGANCTAGKGTERDAILCELLAAKLGRIAAFQANGVAFADEALARCNTKPR